MFNDKNYLVVASYLALVHFITLPSFDEVWRFLANFSFAFKLSPSAVVTADSNAIICNLLSSLLG